MLSSVSASTPASIARTLYPQLTPPSMILPTLLHPAHCPPSHSCWLQTRLCTHKGKGWLHAPSLLNLARGRSILVCGCQELSLGSLSCFFVDCDTCLGIIVATIPDRNNSRKDLLVLVLSDDCRALWGRDSCRCVELSLFMLWLTRKRRGWSQDQTQTSESCPWQPTSTGQTPASVSCTAA